MTHLMHLQNHPAFFGRRGRSNDHHVSRIVSLVLTAKALEIRIVHGDTGISEMEIPVNQRKELETTMLPFARNMLVCCCFATCFLLPISSPLRAQVLAHSGDVSGHVGYGYGNYETSGVGATNSHIEYGGSGGYNVSPNLTFLGEYSYMPMGTYSTVDFKTQLFGGGVRLNMGDSSRSVPYVVATLGGNRFTGAKSGVSVSANGLYVGFGGGASIYFGKNWGVRPEFRYERQLLTFSGLTADTNVIVGTGSIFFQFGGEGKARPGSSHN